MSGCEHERARERERERAEILNTYALEGLLDSKGKTHSISSIHIESNYLLSSSFLSLDAFDSFDQLSSVTMKHIHDHRQTAEPCPYAETILLPRPSFPRAAVYTCV